MINTKNNERQDRELAKFLKNGIDVTVMGMAFLLVSTFFGSSPLAQAVGDGLRTAGWTALGLGLLILGVYVVLLMLDIDFLFKRTTATPSQAPAQTPAGVPTVTTPVSSWGPAAFAAIEWHRFEALCEALFAQAGFETRTQSHGAGGGLNIWLHSRHSKGLMSIVQCKHWQGKPVGVKEMRKFYDVMRSHELQRGIYATTSTFTEDALQFAKNKYINAMDGNKLLALIATRTPEQQQALLAVANEGD
ncbi:MAG: restriction endonuclease [Burkholderiaceae bacterium]|nr:restriction endonuclease [Burkholderiaceae bacterium]